LKRRGQSSTIEVGQYLQRGKLSDLLEREGSNAKPSNTDACITKLTQPTALKCPLTPKWNEA
jgi:hypothetical protein